MIENGKQTRLGQTNLSEKQNSKGTTQLVGETGASRYKIHNYAFSTLSIKARKSKFTPNVKHLMHLLENKNIINNLINMGLTDDFQYTSSVTIYPVVWGKLLQTKQNENTRSF